MGYVNGIDLHREFTYHGKKMILDACYLNSETIEVMLMESADPANEYECIQTKDPEEAEKIYNDIRWRYQDQPHKKLTGAYAKLRDDLRAVVEVAKKKDHGEDGGTCNFDSPAIVMRGWRESMVKQAAKEAGITVFKWNPYSNTCWVFGVPGGGQANRRSRKAEAMTDALIDLGYDAIMYSSMD